MVLVQKQVHYSFTKDLGFVKEGLIRVPLGDHSFELFKQEVSKNPDVISVSGAMWLPPHSNHMHVSMPKVDEPDKMVGVSGLFVDYGFATTMGIKVLRGDDFDATKINSGVLVNESAVKALGLKDIIGEKTVFCLCSICHNHISYMCKDYRSILIPINTLNSLHRSETAYEIQLSSNPYINLFPFGKGTKNPAL